MQNKTKLHQPNSKIKNLISLQCQTKGYNKIIQAAALNTAQAVLLVGRSASYAYSRAMEQAKALQNDLDNAFQVPKTIH